MDPLRNEDITSFLFCPRKLFLHRVLTMKSSSSRRRLQDEILHEALRYTNNFEEGIVRSLKSPVILARVIDAYKSSHSRALQEAVINHKESIAREGLSIIDMSKSVWKDIMTATEMKAKNTYQFMTKNRVYGNELWWQLIPKITMNLEVSSKQLHCSLRISRVDNFPHSSTPILIKRNDGPENGMWHADKIELGACMLALAENSLIVQEGSVMYRFGTQEVSLSMTPELESQVKEVLEGMKRVLTSQQVPDRISNLKKCEHCSLRARCFDDSLVQTTFKNILDTQ